MKPLTKKCNKCGSVLAVERFRRKQGICRGCEVEYAREWKKKHPEMSRASKIRSNRRCGKRPMTDAKDCSDYLGVVVAERVLARVFDGITRMPINNPGYDFICGKGFKIDVKSSCLRQKPYSQCWTFDISYNKIADYFLCLAFDNRELLNPMKIWLIPSGEINFKWSLCITNTETPLLKWSNYELPIDKVVTCCEKLRSD